jgi:hypothetical protein
MPTLEIFSGNETCYRLTKDNGDNYIAFGDDDGALSHAPTQEDIDLIGAFIDSLDEKEWQEVKAKTDSTDF